MRPSSSSVSTCLASCSGLGQEWNLQRLTFWHISKLLFCWEQAKQESLVRTTMHLAASLFSVKFIPKHVLLHGNSQGSYKLQGPGSVVGIATAYGLDGLGIESRWGEMFRTSPDRPWGPHSPLYNGYRVFPGGKVLPGRDADPLPPSSAEV